MARLTDIPKAFIKGIAHSWISLVGAMVVTVVFPFLIGAILYDIFLHIDNPYLSGFIYMMLGPAFIGGLVLVFVGLFFARGKEEVRLFTLDYLREKLTDESSFNRVRKLVFVGVFLTCVNIVVVGVLAYSGYHYMESNAFCGEVCHVPMTPEYTAYQNSAHSRVACVECHIGSGASWFVKSKISGARQLYAVLADTFSRPIQTPVHGLRPARDTCEQCHRPEKFHGDKLVIHDKYQEDEQNTHVQTVLLVKIGSAGDRTGSSHGIHWHVAPENEIVYTAADWQRNIIPEVDLSTQGGNKKIFRSPDADEQIAKATDLQKRVLDCIDCHNRPSHIYLTPDRAIDNKILAKDIPVELPFIKQQAMAAVQVKYKTQGEAKTAIAVQLNNYYRQKYPQLYDAKRKLIEQAIAGVQAAYVENVFPEMNIQWNTYSTNIGHANDLGCFRCHNEEHETADGEVISMDCDTCHTILAEDEENPEIIKTLLGQ
ncbi:NapC/NirT family cytochrome c [Pelobacter seleniigenes]|uniref:NapC/NirT family cytochrome c n=1 Tax=Pelobacter seleniigenes TaxID=407188 RepID=UPI00068E381A|nr:NapC/NirT family cytochrome c [Pelobacter seleniigenes]